MNPPACEGSSKRIRRSPCLWLGVMFLAACVMAEVIGPPGSANVTAPGASAMLTPLRPTPLDEALWANMGHESWYAQNSYVNFPPASKSSSQPLQVFLPVLARQALPTPTARPTPSATPLPTPSPTAWQPPNGVEARAVWLTRFDWTCVLPNCQGGQPPGPSAITEMVANIAAGGFNMILFQVRATGDAFYTPGLEPWSARLTGTLTATLGVNPGWDPLAVMLYEAHSRGIQVHAYLNVYPVWLGTSPPPEQTTPVHPFWAWSHAQGSTWSYWRQWDSTHQPMLLNSNYLWASPGNDWLVQNHIVAVATDILQRYAVDGLHLDMLRYANSGCSCDPVSEARWGAPCFANGDYQAWQRSQVTHLINRIYLEAIEPAGRRALLSAAVWWYPRDLWDFNCSGGYDSYYQDSQGWLSSGVIDAEMPMLYGCPAFADGASGDANWAIVMQDWLDHAAGRYVIPGIQADLSFSSIVARINAQREYAAAIGGVFGHAVYSYGVISSHHYWDDFASGPYRYHADAPVPGWHP